MIPRLGTMDWMVPIFGSAGQRMSATSSTQMGRSTWDHAYQVRFRMV